MPTRIRAVQKLTSSKVLANYSLFGYASCDLVLMDMRIIIEFDSKISRRCEEDEFCKMEAAYKNGYTFIRIFISDSFDWRTCLKEHLYWHSYSKVIYLAGDFKEYSAYDQRYRAYLDCN